MTDKDGSPVAIREHAAAALAEIRQAFDELSARVTSEEHIVGEAVLAPAQRLVRGVAGFAEVAVDPLAQFVERQRELADQMASWAELQHQLADSMAAWAELQRQLANAMALWLAPAGGAAQLTTRVVHKLAGSPEPASGMPAPRRSAAKRAGRAATRHDGG